MLVLFRFIDSVDGVNNSKEIIMYGVLSGFSAALFF